VVIIHLYNDMKKQHQCSLTVNYNSFNVGLVKFHSG